MKTNAALTESLLEVAWRQWTALGVAGAVAPATAAIGLEELLLLTATLSDDDPRLRDEALDWCVSFGSLVAKPRLKTLLAASPALTRAAFAPFAAAYQSLTDRTWPGAGAASGVEVRTTGKSRLGDLSQPALINLRTRRLFGVGARADLLTALLASEETSWSAPELTYVGYTRRNIAQILDDLADAGLLRSRRVRTQVRFEWRQREHLERLVGPLPSRFPRWFEWERVMTKACELAVRECGTATAVLGIEAHKLLVSLESDLAALRVQAPMLSNRPSEAWDEFGAWITQLADEYAEDAS